MRKPRILRDGALYHVTFRANRKELILEPHHMKNLFVDVLRRAKGKYNFQLDNFCIMGNHVHLMLRPKGSTNLSRLMQWILSVFAMAYNRIHGLTGHVWGCRFYSRIINGLMDFLQIFSYVDNNPVESHLILNKRDWRFGGIWHHRAGIIDVCGYPRRLLSLICPEHSQLMLA